MRPTGDSPGYGGDGGSYTPPPSSAKLYNNGSQVSGYDIASTTFNVQAGQAANVLFLIFGRQGYNAGLKSWNAAMIVDGNIVQTAGGAGGYTDCFSMAKTVSDLGPGNHTFEFQWRAQDTTVSLSGVTCTIQVLYK